MIFDKFKNNLLAQLNKNLFTQDYQNIINDINLLEDNLKTLDDTELKLEHFKLQQEALETKNLNLLIQRSFAITREVSFRTIGLRHYDVQLIGGLVLNSNKIAEMKTGEGKTLVATLPASLNALTKKGVHIITVNDYLASRDQVAMGQIYRFTSFNTGLIQEGMSQSERKKSYQSDITYVTNSELTFDYLRDNVVVTTKGIVLRPFNFGIIDEVDSILIDEAQTPIILASPIQELNPEKFIIASEIVKYLELNTDYQVDEKNRNVILRDLGSQKVEKILNITDLYDPQDPWIPYIINALKAATLFFNNIHYIIQKGRVVIVDEFTGRIMPDRRWGEGLHQAIEAKEKVGVRPRTQTQASITYQNFFLMYPKLSGMTGTGKTAQVEFEEIYTLPVEIIPTFKPSQRIDSPDLIYGDQFSKWDGIAKFCKTVSATDQPILVGTTTVEKSDLLAQLLDEYKLPYQLLNAKPENARRESQIVSQAGTTKSITIATNLAGRGTDIILGGNINDQIQRDLYTAMVEVKCLAKTVSFWKVKKYIQTLVNRLISSIDLRKNIHISNKLLMIFTHLSRDKIFKRLSDTDILRILQDNDRIATPKFTYQCFVRFLVEEVRIYYKKHQYQESIIIKNRGGLCVIGTERNDSRRVDNQLRGRCGRQGDPGTSCFFLSLDDNLLRLFGGSNLQRFIKDETGDKFPLESKYLNKTLDLSQQRVEERAYEQRKNLFKYDENTNKQRNIIYFERRTMLENYPIRIDKLVYMEQLCCFFLMEMLFRRIKLFQITQGFELLIDSNFEILNITDFAYRWITYDRNEWKNYFYQELWLSYLLKSNAVSIYGDKIYQQLERTLAIAFIDTIWREHLERLVILREAVGWRGYGQQDPLTEYKRDSYELFLERKESFIYVLLYHSMRLILI